jgi:hypothetical protein
MIALRRYFALPCFVPFFVLVLVHELGHAIAALLWARACIRFERSASKLASWDGAELGGKSESPSATGATAHAFMERYQPPLIPIRRAPWQISSTVALDTLPNGGCSDGFGQLSIRIAIVQVGALRPW